jgi:hypothetical protein
VKLQNLDTFSAIERRKWKLNTYKAEISLLRLLDVKRKHKAALHSWNVDLIHWPWFSFWKQEKRKPNINPWFGQAVTCAFFFVCHSCYFRWHVGEAYENIWNTKTDGGGTVHEKKLRCHILLFICMVFEFKTVAMSSAANCIINEALCRRHSVRLESGLLQTAYFCS